MAHGGRPRHDDAMNISEPGVPSPAMLGLRPVISTDGGHGRRIEALGAIDQSFSRWWSVWGKPVHQTATRCHGLQLSSLHTGTGTPLEDGWSYASLGPVIEVSRSRRPACVEKEGANTAPLLPGPLEGSRGTAHVAWTAGQGGIAASLPSN